MTIKKLFAFIFAPLAACVGGTDSTSQTDAMNVATHSPDADLTGVAGMGMLAGDAGVGGQAGTATGGMTAICMAAMMGMGVATGCGGDAATDSPDGGADTMAMSDAEGMMAVGGNGMTTTGGTAGTTPPVGGMGGDAGSSSTAGAGGEAGTPGATGGNSGGNGGAGGTAGTSTVSDTPKPKDELTPEDYLASGSFVLIEQSNVAKTLSIGISMKGGFPGCEGTAYTTSMTGTFSGTHIRPVVLTDFELYDNDGYPQEKNFQPQRLQQLAQNAGQSVGFIQSQAWDSASQYAPGICPGFPKD